MRVFIVHAHPEPKSFSGAMTRAASAALRSAGHEIVVSDLYAMGFDPVSDRRNFTTVHDPDYYRQQAEEAHAGTVTPAAAERCAEAPECHGPLPQICARCRDGHSECAHWACVHHKCVVRTCPR